MLEPLETRSLRSATLLDESWEAGVFDKAAYVAEAESSVTRTLAEGFAAEFSAVDAALEEVYDSSFIDTGTPAGSDFSVSLADQFASGADTLANYQKAAASEGYLSTAGARPTLATFCRRCLDP